MDLKSKSRSKLFIIKSISQKPVKFCLNRKRKQITKKIWTLVCDTWTNARLVSLDNASMISSQWCQWNKRVNVSIFSVFGKKIKCKDLNYVVFEEFFHKTLNDCNSSRRFSIIVLPAFYSIVIKYWKEEKKLLIIKQFIHLYRWKYVTNNYYS